MKPFIDAVLGILLGGAVCITMAAIIRQVRNDKPKADRTHEAWKRDRTYAGNGFKCACCGGEATKLKLVQPENISLCADRALCQETMRFKSMLEHTRDT